LYSPKIPERLIPELFRLARARRQPMTVLVGDILDAYLAHWAHLPSLSAPPATPEPSRPGTTSGRIPPDGDPAGRLGVPDAGLR
jgi:hypothetical protein